MVQALPDPPTDEELDKFVLDEMRADPRIAAGDVDVISSLRNVALHGVVASMFEKQAAERIARRVVGVAHVENYLEVRPTPRDDSKIRDDLRFNLNSDSLLNWQRIEVAVHDAQVTLSGQVHDYTSRRHAERVSSRVRGVRSISNELKVSWTESTNNEVVKLAIVGRLSSNVITRSAAQRIKVAVEKDVVTLSGKVDRSSELHEAERIAKRTDGVRKVENQLSVSADER